MISALIALGVWALLVASFWDDVVNWLKSFTQSVANFFRHIGHAAKLFAQKVNYPPRFYKEDNKLYQETTRTEISESEVPEWAKEGVRQSETDVTQRYRQELQLTF